MWLFVRSHPVGGFDKSMALMLMTKLPKSPGTLPVFSPKKPAGKKC